MPITNKMNETAYKLIDEWKACDLGFSAKSKLKVLDELRIDNQGQINDCVNLQIQLSGQRSSSTTLAQIIVLIETPPDVLRDAFKMSIKLGARMVMLIDKCSESKKKKND